MRCFRKAAQQQHLEEEVKWLQQMLAKEQQSRQVALGQLQDEKAKCALLEMEILHAAQAAQEMGESLCLFFNPCYQQSEQQLLQANLLTAAFDDAEALHDAVTLQLPQAQQQALHYQHQEELQQLQEPMPQHQPDQQQEDLPSDPDTDAHDQALGKTRENAGTVVDVAPTHQEVPLNSPSRLLKATSPNRRHSPRRLARSSPSRSLSSSNPLKQAVLAAAAAAAAVPPAGPAEGSKLEFTETATGAAAVNSTAVAAAGTSDCVTSALLSTQADQGLYAVQKVADDTLTQQHQALPLSGGAAAQAGPSAAACGAIAEGGQQSAAEQQPDSQTVSCGHVAAAKAALEAAAADAGGRPVQMQAVPAAALHSKKTTPERSPFTAAAAAAAAAIQQSVSAASAAIAAAEATRAHNRAAAAARHPGLPAPLSSVLSGSRPGNAVRVTEVNSSSNSSGSCSNSSTSEASSSKQCAAGASSHKLPPSIVSEVTPVATEAVDSPGSKAGSHTTPATDILAGLDAGTTATSIRAAASLCSSDGSNALEPPAAGGLLVAGCSSTTTPSTSTNPTAGGCQGVAASPPEGGSVEQDSAASRCWVHGGPGCQQAVDTVRSSSVDAHHRLQPPSPPPSLQQQQQGSGQAAVLIDAAAAAGSTARTASQSCTVNGRADQEAAAGSSSNGVLAADGTNRGSSGMAHGPRHSGSSNSNKSICMMTAGNTAAATAQSLADTTAPTPAKTTPQPPAANALQRQRSCNTDTASPRVQPAAESETQLMAIAADEHCGLMRKTSSSSIGGSASAVAAGLESKGGPKQQQHQQVNDDHSGVTEADKPREPVATAEIEAEPTPPPPPSVQHNDKGSTVMRRQTGSGDNRNLGGSLIDRRPHRGQPPAPSMLAQRPPAAHYGYRNSSGVLPPRPPTHHKQQQHVSTLQGRRGYDSLAGSTASGWGGQPLLPKPHSLCRSYGAALGPTAAAAALSKARLAAGECAAAAAAVSAGGLSGSLMAAATNPSSCLSPLHTHQGNLGSSRGEFYQAMMLSACSNPSSVMRQQAAFDQQDTSVLRAVQRQLGGKVQQQVRVCRPGSTGHERAGWLCSSARYKKTHTAGSCSRAGSYDAGGVSSSCRVTFVHAYNSRRCYNIGTARLVASL